MKHHSFTFLFLFLHNSYFRGVIAGVAMFVALGLIYEAVFWLKVFKDSRAGSTH